LTGRRVSIKPDDVFGAWTVLRLAEVATSNNKRWWCRCCCGTEKRVFQSALLRKGTGARSQSCGCLSSVLIARSNTKHGESSKKTESPEYRSWRAMKDRCDNPEHVAWKRYGGRGITVCPKWSDSYEAFLADVGRRPSPQHTLGRIDNSKGYAPGNVEWQTRTQQNRNSSNNRIVFRDGVGATVADWCEKLGLSKNAVYQRLYRGWSEQRVFEQHVRGGKKATCLARHL
jgi:hypothetical protein